MAQTATLKDGWDTVRALRPSYDDLLHLSPEIVGVILGVPTWQAENGLSRAAVRVSRQSRLNAAAADFLRCAMPENKPPTTGLYKLIRNARVPDDTAPEAA